MHLSPRGPRPGAFLVALLFALVGTPLGAQQTTGKVEGRVVDAATQQPLVGAQVTVVGTGYGNITNQDGYYFINNVPAGVHALQAQYVGYQTMTVENQRVIAGGSNTVSFELPQTAVALEAITVQGEANPLLQRDQVISKAIVTGDVVDAIPVENVRAVVSLQPGVVETGDRRGQVIRGGRPGEAAVYIDGVLVRNFNSGAQSEVTLQTNSVEQVDVLLGGFGAEYGQAQSGVINLISRGGGTEWSGSVGIETDQITIGDSYGYTRLEAAVSGPILGEKLGFSISGTLIGMEDARPTFMGSEIGSQRFTSVVTGEELIVPAGQTRFFRPTGEFTTVTNEDGESFDFPDYEEITGLDNRKPWNNGDEYNFNLTFRGMPVGGTRYNAGVTLTRNQRRFFDPQGQFRPHGLQGRREKGMLLRAGLEQQLFQEADRSASVRVSVGWGRDEFARGPLGETLADTARVISGDLYPMEGDVLGFTFDDFKFFFEDTYTIDAWYARFEQMKQDASLSYLVPFETLINPETGEPYTLQEATNLFQTNYGPGDPFGTGEFFATGFFGYGYRLEKTLSGRVDLDWQVNRWNRIAIGAEGYKKDIENIGNASAFANAVSGVSNTSPSFQNVYEASPTIAGFYAKDRVDLGEIVLEVGARVDYFNSDVEYPEIPGFVLPATTPEGEQVLPNFITQDAQWQLSPRLGVGFPVTANTQFRLSYGHFTQVPALNWLFAGITGDLTKTNPNAVFGRPIEFGRTIGYEAGFTHLFGANTVIDISGYAREKQGDIAFRTEAIDLPGNPNTVVRYLTSADFGYVRGVDTRLTRRFGELLNLQGTYSYLDTRSTGSDPNTYTTTIGRQVNPITGETLPAPQSAFAADFDQTHTINLSGALNTPRDFMEENRTANLLLRDVNLSLAFRAASGTPYTRTSNAGVTSDIIGADPTFAEEINASRLPWSTFLNGRLGKGFGIGDSRLTAYVDGRNLLNAKNVNVVWTLTADPVNPGSQYLQSNTSAGSRVAATDIVIDNVSDAIQQERLRRREALWGNADGLFTREEQQISSIQSFLAAGYDTDTDYFPGYFFGQPRQIRFGLEWRF